MNRFGGVKYQETKSVKILKNWNLTDDEIDEQIVYEKNEIEEI